MRRLILAFALAAPLLGCGKSEEGDGTAAGTAMTAEAIATNDVTAIDAVTGEAANMAADVRFDTNQDADGNESSNAAASARRPAASSDSSAPAPARPSSPPPAATQPASEPQRNSTE